MSLTEQYFDKYKSIHGKFPDYFWQLRLDENDYAELKKKITSLGEKKYLRPSEDDKDVALFLSEWWRNDYAGGIPGMSDVCKFLGVNLNCSEALYEAAQRGFRKLGYGYITIQNTYRWYSILYHGGIPMNYIAIDPKDNSGWHRFFKQLAWQGQDFSLIKDLRVIYSRSSSVKDFCAALQKACVNGPEDLPFHMNPNWWSIIKKDINEGVRKQKESNPFDLTWFFRMDDVAKKILVSFTIKGPRNLPQMFIDANNLNGRSSISFSLRVNDVQIQLAEYNESFFSRHKVEKIISCPVNSVIELVVNETGKLIWQKSIDFFDPKLIRLENEMENDFVPCKPSCMQNEPCRVIASEDWTADGLQPQKYEMSGIVYNVFMLEASFKPFELNSEVCGEVKIFNAESPIAHTMIGETDETCIGVQTIEKVYDASKISFVKESDGIITRNCPVLFANGNNRTWENKPQIGRVRAKIHDNNQSIESVSFINVGKLTVNTLNSSSNSCELEILWPDVEGTVTSEEASAAGDNLWYVEKAKLADPRYIVFDFSPQFGNRFKLHLIAQFYDFQIFDPKGKVITNSDIIPIADMGSYRYYLKIKSGDVVTMCPNRVQCELKYIYSNNSDLHGNIVKRIYFNDPKKETTIPYEGYLSSLLMEGGDIIYDQLDQTTMQLPDAESILMFSFNGNSPDRYYHFKEFPYRLNYYHGSISKNDCWDDALLAIPVDEPGFAAVELIRDDSTQGRYVLPDEILSSEKRFWFIYGAQMGHFLPCLINLDEMQEENTEYPDPVELENRRKRFRRDKLKSIQEELLTAPIFSSAWERAIDWYNRLPDGCVPGTSVLELVAISDNRDLMCKFALQMYILNCNDEYELELLKSSLIDFQRQMSFLWIWAASDYGNFAENLSDEYVNKIILNADVSNELKLKYLQQHKYSEVLSKSFHLWFETLRKQGVPKQTLENPDINNMGDRLFSAEARKVFNMMKKNGNLFNMPRTGNPNDDWIQIRRTFSNILECTDLNSILDILLKATGAFNVTDDENLIVADEYVRREIRKNIIYGLKFKKAEI